MSAKPAPTPAPAHRLTTPRTFAAACAALALLAFAAGACSKRITEVDETYVYPEGRQTVDAQMIAWYEDLVQVSVYADATEPPGPESNPRCPGSIFADPGDPLVDVENYDFLEVGSINVAILDHTPANAYRPMRREANGGYRSALDYTLRPTRKWLEGQWELYRHNDTRPSGFTPPTYVARGVVNGLESADSPLTNEGVLQLAQPADIRYTGLCLPCDSLFTLRWDPVPGAVRYWLHVYQLANGATEDDDLRSMRGAPINDVRPSDFLLAYVGDSVFSYRLKDASRTDIVRLVERTPAYNQTYRVRIAAVDSLGQLIALTRGDNGLMNRAENYGLVRLNAYNVVTKRPGPSPPFCQTEGASFAQGRSDQ